MPNPVTPRMKSTAAAAMPILAPRVRPLEFPKKADAEGVADGDVMFTVAVENTDPWIEIVEPAAGC